MFFGQLLKIVLIAFVIYWIVRLVRFLIGVGSAIHTAQNGGTEKEPRTVREDQGRLWRGRRDTIELDKDQYKVE